jgi:hypothetical protein
MADPVETESDLGEAADELRDRLAWVRDYL